MFVRKKFWYVPIIAHLLEFEIFIVLTEGVEIVPFIYALF